MTRRLLLVAGGGGSFTLPEDDVALGWINAKTYSAVGDGATDDTAAINSAIALATTSCPQR